MFNGPAIDLVGQDVESRMNVIVFMHIICTMRPDDRSHRGAPWSALPACLNGFRGVSDARLLATTGLWTKPSCESPCESQLVAVKL